MDVRPAGTDDAPRLADLLRAYVGEALEAEWHGSVVGLRELIEAGDARILVAAAGTGSIVGFLAWSPAYDLHHCIRGGTVDDMYVEPSSRGRGIGAMLLVAGAARVRDGGGVFLRGTAVPDPSARRLYGRAAVCHETMECTISGRAFRRVAELTGRSSREIAGSLPDLDWNHSR